MGRLGIFLRALLPCRSERCNSVLNAARTSSWLCCFMFCFVSFYDSHLFNIFYTSFHVSPHNILWCTVFHCEGVLMISGQYAVDMFLFFPLYKQRLVSVSLLTGINVSVN